MKTLPLILLLIPAVVFGQDNDKKKYKQIDAPTLSNAVHMDECNFKMIKVILVYTGDGQKINADKGKTANERLKKCKLQIKNPDWMVGSTEVSFRDRSGNTFWLYSDNNKLNFHDWVTGKEYLLYIKMVDGKDKLLFLNEVEPGT